MNILFVLIPISMVLLLIIIGTFVWAVRKGQFEDLDAAAIDILSDEAPPPGAPAPRGSDAPPPPVENTAPAPRQDRQGRQDNHAD